VIAGPIRLMYIPSKLFVHGNASATATNNIAAHETLFRLGIVSDLFCGIILIFVVLALYRLLKGVDQNHAVLMVILGGVLPSAIDFFIVLNDAAALILVRGADFLSVFDKAQRDALAILFLRIHGQGILAAEIRRCRCSMPFRRCKACVVGRAVDPIAYWEIGPTTQRKSAVLCEHVTSRRCPQGAIRRTAAVWDDGARS
jgi:hypothetical protein